VQRLSVGLCAAHQPCAGCLLGLFHAKSDHIDTTHPHLHVLFIFPPICSATASAITQTYLHLTFTSPCFTTPHQTLLTLQLNSMLYHVLICSAGLLQSGVLIRGNMRADRLTVFQSVCDKVQELFGPKYSKTKHPATKPYALPYPYMFCCPPAVWRAHPWQHARRPPCSCILCLPSPCQHFSSHPHPSLLLTLPPHLLCHYIFSLCCTTPHQTLLTLQPRELPYVWKT
jgi:hypothetical protein